MHFCKLCLHIFYGRDSLHLAPVVRSLQYGSISGIAFISLRAHKSHNHIKVVPQRESIMVHHTVSLDLTFLSMIMLLFLSSSCITVTTINNIIQNLEFCFQTLILIFLFFVKELYEALLFIPLIVWILVSE